MRRRTEILVLAIAFASYVLLGLPSGLLGVAWPSIRESFGLSLDAMGTMLTTVTIGYILSSFNSGRLIARFGAGALLMIGSMLMGASMLGYVVAPNWRSMVAFGLLLGLGSGIMDAGLNTYVAENYEARHMNWLHASFGIGVTIAPVIMTTVLNVGQSWRWGYVLVVVLEAVLAACYALTRNLWRSAEPTSARADPGSRTGKARSLHSLKLPIVWLGIALFIIHPGIEFVAGNWVYSLFTEARSVTANTASLWVSIYWGSLTVGRLVLGSVADRLGVDRLLRVCIIGILLGSALVWWNVADPISFLGLALIGFGVAPLFPSMISSTPRWMGAAHAANAIGFQVAAAGVGIALLPGFAGILAQKLGLEIIGQFLVGATIIMLLMYEVLVYHGARRPREEATS